VTEREGTREVQNFRRNKNRIDFHQGDRRNILQRRSKGGLTRAIKDKGLGPGEVDKRKKRGDRRKRISWGAAWKAVQLAVR